jgi:hypothetical protein
MSNKDDSAPGPAVQGGAVRPQSRHGFNWGEGEATTDRESSYSKQMLKEMIERKRRNDFVRKREFDMLRKMRAARCWRARTRARPSFFQSSMPSKPDDRATTLKKIDEIEAQMSMQWWKTKHGAARRRRGAAAASRCRRTCRRRRCAPARPAAARRPRPATSRTRRRNWPPPPRRGRVRAAS